MYICNTQSGARTYVCTYVTHSLGLRTYMYICNTQSGATYVRMYICNTQSGATYVRMYICNTQSGATYVHNITHSLGLRTHVCTYVTHSMRILCITA